MPYVIKSLPLSHPALSIICTAGPSIFRAETEGGACRPKKSLLPELLKAGMGIVRINFSHIQPKKYQEIECLIKHIRDIESKERIPIPILMDLKGPEIRVSDILDSSLKSVTEKPSKSDSVELNRSELIELSTSPPPADPISGSAQWRLVLKFEGNLYPQLIREQTVVIGDNDLYLRIDKKVPGGVLCVTENQGTVKIGKSLNLPDLDRLDAPILVQEDKEALNRSFDVDLIAQSFVQKQGDVQRLIGFLDGTPLRNKPVIVKIETPSAVDDIDKILVTDGVFGVMVARGDLGVLADFRKIPQLQRKIIDSANKLGKPVIVATQMLESMIERPKPWRPEVQDISTAIEEGADTLMLSGETAVGHFPEESVKVMAEVIKVNMPVDREKYIAKFGGEYAVPSPRRPIDVIGYAICEAAKEAKSPFILSYATTGISATLISRFRPKVPIIAITNRPDTARKLCLLYNVYPVLVNKDPLPRKPGEFIEFLRQVIAELDLKGYAKPGVFLVGTQELTTIVGPGGGAGRRARGVFVFEP